MSKSVASIKRTRVQKICTLWTHDENFSKDDVVFNVDKFPELSVTVGSLIQVIALKQAPSIRDFQISTKTNTKDANPGQTESETDDASHSHHQRRSRRGSVVMTLDENGSVLQNGRDVDIDKSYVFVAKPLSPDLKSKQPNLQISLSEKIAKVFGLRARMQVVVTLAHEESHSASHVEVAFRDEYLARADMWRMSNSELSNRTVYRGQKVLFMGTIKATIRNVYINGQSTHSGYFSALTKPVFRSESARYVLFIQMSKEMWDFDAEGAGEIMFNKVVNGFLPDLFKRWMRINARHLVTIILFTRMEYDGQAIADQPDETTNRRDFEDHSKRYRDYYRVVVSDMASGDWINILYQLKKEFRAFLRDVSLVAKTAKGTSVFSDQDLKDVEHHLVISGKPSAAANGNILEAINLASAQFAKDYIDRDLVRTGISVVVITAGTGVFEVDYSMLKLTTDTLVGSGIGIDLVCLSPMPLHSVPLFKYRNPRSVSVLKQVLSRSGTASPTSAFDEQDEKTPRQYQPNFGSIIHRSPRQPPPILSSDPPILPPEENDEWRYAMPHWVDISFWSGPSDEIVELSKPRKSINKVTKSKKKKGNSFALRCRMYELQMMGVMENELGDIAIPYLEENASYPHQWRDYGQDKMRRSQEGAENSRALPGKADTFFSKEVKIEAEDQLDPKKSLQVSWMERYDHELFSENTQIALETKSPKRHTPEAYLASSYLGRSFGNSARPSPDTNLHQLMRERSKYVENQSPRESLHPGAETRGLGVPRADVLHRQSTTSKSRNLQRPTFHQRGGSGDSTDTRSSRYSTPDRSPAVSRGNTPPKRSGLPPLPSIFPGSTTKVEKGSRPAGWFLRQISFGGRAASVSGPTASLAIADVTAGSVKPAILTGENNQRGEIAAKLASTKITEVEKPSKPINIRAASRAGMSKADSPSSDHAPKSVETVRGIPPGRATSVAKSSSLTKDSSSTFLFAGSRGLAASIGPKKDISGGAPHEAPRTLSPTSALAPWAVLVNPCNPKKNNTNIAHQFRRWQHVFPKRLKTSSVKWKSLCSPAAVPLTNEYFPTSEQLAQEYNESPYKISQSEDDDSGRSQKELIHELIAFRLSHGFQIVVGSGVAEVAGGREQDLSSIFQSDYMTKDGDTVFMCVGNTIHQLVCAPGGEVEVKRFSRKPTTALQDSAGAETPFRYKPFIRTALEGGYHARSVVLRPPQREYNWNFIDTFLAGYHDEFSDVLRFWRARFVLIPIELPVVNRRPLPLLTEDSEEEIRLEGIRKLTQIWQRYRHDPVEDGSSQTAGLSKQKDPNPLAIEYHTRDPSVVVAAGPDSALLNDENDAITSIFSETEQFHSSNIDIKKLAEYLQGEKGIPVLDRRWHWRLHYNCFLGFDLTSWLLSNFKDIQTRDEAVDLGNRIMEKGLFQHVQKRHQFRDGNFFYQIAAEYRAPRPESKSGWFGMRRTDRSVPSTPVSEGPRTSPLTARSRGSRPGTSDTSSVSGDEKDGEKTPTRYGTPKRKVTLSCVMRYDVDPRKRSYRQELINLHYDRLHNPDNCYHIRIDWMNVTAKLIEDAIVTWATSVEKFGLKLVEVPIGEACNIMDHHPFRSPYIVKLALQPPQSQLEPLWEALSFSPQLKAEKFPYHKALLRKLNFVLDMEAASCFPSDVDVTYSWGQPDYKYTQFIHRSGTVLAQITDEGDFLLLANRLAHNRAKDTTRFRPTDPYENKLRKSPGGGTATGPTTPSVERANPHRSPFSSPLARPVQDSSLLHTALQDKLPMANPPTLPTSNLNAPPLTPESVKDQIEALCSDPQFLKTFYEEALRARQAPSPSPRLAPVLDSSIPSLGLPPAISIREASPLGQGWAGIGGGVAVRRQGSEGSGREREGSMPKRQDSQGSAGSGV
ncbi:hypothetical protein P154DRAFT_503876 [Amniculicola lignicola CBS 123094]|uniref:Vacuolar membrane-associated protein IML1 n=1 Tax=Amniculicola lignicola CBS 123094 TaxID=1392246 RepID=A0A6A5VW66_9PLEO|nr:hypothetical protein P154DRAFT_503876 [Amniculicola lignicola CBS 123094]